MVGAHMKEKVVGNRTIDTGTTHTIKAGQLFATGADEVIFKCGKAMISMKSSGEMQIIGGEITAKATAAFRVKGMKVSKFGPDGTTSDIQMYDEQFHLVDADGETPLEFRSYRITASNGQIWEGISDEDGLTERIYTDTAVDLSIEIYPKEEMKEII
jgi:type VI secretion system secreted protein VgrG